MDISLLNSIIDEVMQNPKIPPDARPTVELYTRRVVNQIKIRCNRDDIPPKLALLAAEITEDMLTVDKAVPGLVADKEVVSIQRGDTNIRYQEKGPAASSVTSFLKDYNRQLVRFKKPNIPRTES